MIGTMTRRRTSTVFQALIGLLLTTAPAWAQARITWTVDLPYQAKEIWSMNPDGSGKASLVPGGFAPPAPYDQISQIAGPSVGTYPLDPANPNSPRVHWFLATLTSETSDQDVSELRADLFAFAPDGLGGVVWRQLSAMPREPEPGKWEYISNGFVLPTSPDDAFASTTIYRVYFDGPTFWDSTVWIETMELVRLSNPFELPELSVTRADFTTVIPERPIDQEILSHSWSPDGTTVAYIRRPRYANSGVSPHAALRIYSAPAGTDVFLLDSQSSGVTPSEPRWSPNGMEIAFGGTSSLYGANTGTYAVNPFAGTLRAIATKGSSANYIIQPVWSPDASLMAAVQYYYGSNSKLANRYAIARFPSSGVTKKNAPVLLTPTTDPYRYLKILNWR